MFTQFILINDVRRNYLYFPTVAPTYKHMIILMFKMKAILVYFRGSGVLLMLSDNSGRGLVFVDRVW